MSTPTVTPAPSAPAQSASSIASQQAALNRLLAKYKAAKTQGDLTSLGRQITAAAKASRPAPYVAEDEIFDRLSLVSDELFLESLEYVQATASRILAAIESTPEQLAA